MRKFSKCECPGGYAGDPCAFSPESKDVHQCHGECVISIFQNVNVEVATMVILALFPLELKDVHQCHGECLISIFQNVNVRAATMAILTFFVNVLVMKNMLEIKFFKM